MVKSRSKYRRGSKSRSLRGKNTFSKNIQILLKYFSQDELVHLLQIAKTKGMNEIEFEVESIINSKYFSGGENKKTNRSRSRSRNSLLRRIFLALSMALFGASSSGALGASQGASQPAVALRGQEGSLKSVLNNLKPTILSFGYGPEAYKITYDSLSAMNIRTIDNLLDQYRLEVNNPQLSMEDAYFNDSFFSYAFQAIQNEYGGPQTIEEALQEFRIRYNEPLATVDDAFSRSYIFRDQYKSINLLNRQRRELGENKIASLRLLGINEKTWLYSSDNERTALVKQAFRKKSRGVGGAHPDVGGTQEKFIRLLEAKEFLLQEEE